MRTLILVVALALTAGCAGLRPVRGPVEEGIASYYHDSLAGRLTASGQPYDPSDATCAHRTHAFGTHLEIVVVDTGRRTVCRVNDRGPFVKGRIVDVSRALAEELGIVERGIAPVQVRVRSAPR